MAENKNWMDTVSETIDKAAKAATEAWDGTADLRREAWEKTKTAVNSASDALDEGVEQAKRSFDGTDESGQQVSEAQAEPEIDEPDEHEDSAEPDVT